MSGSAVPGLCSNSTREKALPEAGLGLSCAEDSGEQGRDSSGQRKIGENRKAARIPEYLGGPPQGVKLLSLSQGSGFAMELPG